MVKQNLTQKFPLKSTSKTLQKRPCTFMQHFHGGFCGLTSEVHSEPLHTFTIELFCENNVKIKNLIKVIITK